MCMTPHTLSPHSCLLVPACTCPRFRPSPPFLVPAVCQTLQLQPAMRAPCSQRGGSGRCHIPSARAPAAGTRIWHKDRGDQKQTSMFIHVHPPVPRQPASAVCLSKAPVPMDTVAVSCALAMHGAKCCACTLRHPHSNAIVSIW